MMTTIETGAASEDLAVALLRARGYRVVERNYRCKLGELDIVAYDGAVLCFVEVRSRASDEHGGAELAIGPRKRAQVARVAQVYLGDRAVRCDETRFDVVAITAGSPVLIQDAWRL